MIHNYSTPTICERREEKEEKLIGDMGWITGLSGTMCLPTGRPMPERVRREEARDRTTTPLPPMIRDPTLLSLPAISLPFTLLSSQHLLLFFSHAASTPEERNREGEAVSLSGICVLGNKSKTVYRERSLFCSFRSHRTAHMIGRP